MILLHTSKQPKKIPFYEKADLVRDILGEAVLYDQLAEECSELIQASCKKARKIRGRNFTPKTMNEIDSNVKEEINDIFLVLYVLKMHQSIDMAAMEDKLDRWIDRLSNRDPDIWKLIIDNEFGE